MFFSVLAFLVRACDIAAMNRLDEYMACRQCGVPIAGRTDKHFCSDRCRSLYNYYRTRERRIVRLRTMGQLDRNYMILGQLLEEEVEEMEIPALEKLGFKVDCATSFFLRGRLREYWCYDIRYNISNGRLFNLRRPLEGLMR